MPGISLGISLSDLVHVCLPDSPMEPFIQYAAARSGNARRKTISIVAK